MDLKNIINECYNYFNVKGRNTSFCKAYVRYTLIIHFV